MEEPSSSSEAAVLAVEQADALRLEGQLEKAAAEYRRALAIDETRFDAWYGLGLADLARDAYAVAAQSLRRALALARNDHAVCCDLGKALFYQGEVDDALQYFRRAAETLDPELRSRALGNIACIVPGSGRASNASILEDRRAWAALEARREIPAGGSIPRPHRPDARLRVGYCSKFFHAGNWMKPVWGVINHHDRSAFEIHLFSDGKPPSAESGYQANPQDQVHDVRNLTNAELATLIAGAGIDILVDLNGYSFQQRLGVFMRRPAPVNVGWFNFYATSGSEAFDYIVGDTAVIPSSEEQFYCERVLRVPASYLAYSVPYPVPEVAAPPCLEAGHITFGSLCSLYKITDEVVAAWSTILQRASESELFIKNAGLGNSTNCAALHERFARWEIAAHRVRLEGPAPHEEFLAAYEKVDIALDPFPYNGGTTTMEALWQGVPVLTFYGDRWASRTSRSLLLAAGLDDWCLSDRDSYVARAATLAESENTPKELASLRASLRERLTQMPICDSAGLCGALESIYREVSSPRSSLRGPAR